MLAPRSQRHVFKIASTEPSTAVMETHLARWWDSEVSQIPSRDLSEADVCKSGHLTQPERQHLPRGVPAYQYDTTNACNDSWRARCMLIFR